MPVAKSLGLSEKEVKDLLKVFNKVDKDRSGKVRRVSCAGATRTARVTHTWPPACALQLDLMEFWERIDVIRTPFTKRVFALFDNVSEDDHIDFGEFMLSLYKYCAFPR